MPLTHLQIRILNAIAANRSPENYAAGGSVINASGGRYSNDIDLFSDREEALFRVVGQDEETLRKSGLSIEWKRRDPAFYRAVVMANASFASIDWGVDNDYRFFPTEKDDVFGYRLHPVDLATNKMLAAADRSEPRDILDLVTIAGNLLPLGVVAWAAAEKSPGRSPDTIVGEIRARAKIRQEQVDAENLTTRIDAGDLNNWLRRECGQAQEWIRSIPAEFDFGLFIDCNGKYGAPDFHSEAPEHWTVHTGSRKGSWPSSPGISSEMLKASIPADDDTGLGF